MRLSFKKIDDRRKEIGISVSKLAKEIGVSRKTYYDWENDVIPILAKYAKVISGVLLIDINDISEEDKENLPKEFLRGLSMDVNEIRNRVKFAFNYIITEHNLSNIKLAKTLGLSVSTIDNYRRGLKMPKFETLQFIQNNYKISIDWIMDGEGAPHPGAPGDAPTGGRIHEPAPIYNKDTLPPIGAGVSPEINIDEAIGKTYKVLKSGTPYAVALFLNIQQFSSALDMSVEIQALREELHDLKGQVADLQRQVNRLSAIPATATAQEDLPESQAM